MKNSYFFSTVNSTKFLLTFFLCFSLFIVQAQDKDVPKTEGISVSPAHFHLTQKPGETKSYEITVTNDTRKSKRFKVSALDFNMNGKGKSSFLPTGTGNYSLSKWMNISSSFIEVKAGQKKLVKFTVEVPDDETGNRAAWSVVMLEQEEPRNTIEPPKKGEGTVALGVIPTFAFGVFVYQNPPNVDNTSIEITNFTLDETEKGKIVKIEAKNTGTGIAYCTSYIDLTNLSTGKQQRLLVKRFTIVPELVRDFAFKLPEDLEKGQYVAVGVLDFENSEEIQVAKMKFENK